MEETLIQALQALTAVLPLPPHPPVCLAKFSQLSSLEGAPAFSSEQWG